MGITVAKSASVGWATAADSACGCDRLIFKCPLWPEISNDEIVNWSAALRANGLGNRGRQSIWCCDMRFLELLKKKCHPAHFADPQGDIQPLPAEMIGSLPMIMDIGMNNGRDSLFYLQKGFRVIAVEANPVLVDMISLQLKNFIDSGQLIIERVGLAGKEGEFVFYQNLDNDHWSSFHKEWGTRNNTQYREIAVKCLPPQMLFEKYGVPYYIKIDIEGNDMEVVRALRDFPDRPRYISIEEHQVFYFAELWSLGYRNFKLVNQRDLFKVKCPYPPREGRYVDVSFDGTTSGPFGEETPGEWMAFEQAVYKYLTEIRSPVRGFLAGNAWFDIHARLD